MLAIAMAVSMAVLDGAIANIALPTIARELDVSAASAIWVINAYQLAITICLLPLAALGDKIGYRRVYVVGLAVFTLGSLGCALSHTLAELTTARVFQGLGAAAVMSINSALVRFTYPQRLLGRGIGLNAVVISLSAALGPTLASGILAVATWQWLFAINVPFGIATILIARRALPATQGSGRPFDTGSAVLNAITFGFLIFGAESLAREGLATGLPLLAVGAGAGVWLARRELRQATPLVPLDLMRIPIFGLSVATGIVAFAAQMLAFVALPFDFQEVMGRSAVEAGLLITPWPLAVGISAPIAGRLADRYSAGALGGIGLAMMAFGLSMLAILPPDASTLDIVWRMAVCGLGFGFFQSPNNRAMVTAAPRDRSGAAGGMLATARLLGQTSGALAMAVLFRLAEHHATRVGLTAAAVLAGLAAGVSLLRLRAGEHPSPAAPEVEPVDAA